MTINLDSHGEIRKMMDPDGVVEKYVVGLKERKGEFWARKVHYLSGIRSSCQALLNAGHLKTTPHKIPMSDYGKIIEGLVVRDVVHDMMDKYPGRDMEELTSELAEDSNTMMDLVQARTRAVVDKGLDVEAIRKTLNLDGGD